MGEMLNPDLNVERAVAERSMLLKHILIDVPDALNEPIPLDKVCPPHRSLEFRDTHRDFVGERGCLAQSHRMVHSPSHRSASVGG